MALTEARVAALEALADADEASKRELRYWRTRLSTAQLTPAPAGDTAAFGTRVRIRLGGRERTIEIVGDDEADPAVDRHAVSPPLAPAQIRPAAGDRVDFNGRSEAIEVLAVAPI